MKNMFLSHDEAATRNRNLVLRYIRENAPVSRTGIWENIDMSRASVTQIIKQFQENGMIADCFRGTSTGGRKPLYIEFDGKSSLFFAFDWTTRSLYLMNLGGEILYESRLGVENGASPESFAQAVKKTVRGVFEKKLCDEEKLVGFTMALPGVINANEGKLILSVELGWQNVDVRALFEDVFKNIYIERTLNLMALAEASNRRKSNRASHVQLFIFDGSGIGVSTVIHGNIQHGLRCMHGELGHIKLFSNELCSCGQRGCLEAIIKRRIFECGGEVTDEILDYMAIGISTAVNICDTDVILTGSYVDKMTEAQKSYLKKAVISRITTVDHATFEIDYIYNNKQMMQKGLCEYTFNCCYPTL